MKKLLILLVLLLIQTEYAQDEVPAKYNVAKYNVGKYGRVVVSGKKASKVKKTFDAFNKFPTLSK